MLWLSIVVTLIGNNPEDLVVFFLCLLLIALSCGALALKLFKKREVHYITVVICSWYELNWFSRSLGTTNLNNWKKRGLFSLNWGLSAWQGKMSSCSSWWQVQGLSLWHRRRVCGMPKGRFCIVQREGEEGNYLQTYRGSSEWAGSRGPYLPLRQVHSCDSLPHCRNFEAGVPLSILPSLHAISPFVNSQSPCNLYDSL